MTSLLDFMLGHRSLFDEPTYKVTSRDVPADVFHAFFCALVTGGPFPVTPGNAPHFSALATEFSLGGLHGECQAALGRPAQAPGLADSTPDRLSPNGADAIRALRLGLYEAVDCLRRLESTLLKYAATLSSAPHGHSPFPATRRRHRVRPSSRFSGKSTLPLSFTRSVEVPIVAPRFTGQCVRPGDVTVPEL
jgi:hypothetical protein